MSKITENKKPFNAFYICLWYAIFLYTVASIILLSSEETTHSLYLFLKNLGAEDVLVSIPRPSHIRDFLIAQNNVTRWESIMSYFTLLLSGLVVSLSWGLYQSHKYLVWYQKQVDSPWNKPLENKMAKIGRRSAWFLGFYILFMTWEFVIGTSIKVHNFYGVHRDIYLSDRAYFSLALSTSLFVFCALCLQSIIYRFVHNKRL